MRKKLKVGSLVYVEWEDSLGCPRGWDDIDVCLDSEIATIRSIGWVARVTKRFVVLVPHASSSGCTQGQMTIPLSGFLKVKTITGLPRLSVPTPGGPQ